MREGTLYFFLKLNTEGNTSWEYEDTEKLNALYSSYLEEVKYNLCNNDGYFHLISIGFELKQNRIAVDFSYMLYDKFTEEFVDMLDDFIDAVSERISSVIKDKNIRVRNTARFWFNADTIIFDDEPVDGVFYPIEIVEVDKIEAAFKLNKLSAG